MKKIGKWSSFMLKGTRNTVKSIALGLMFLGLFSTATFAAQGMKGKRVNLKLNNVTLSEVLSQVESQSDFVFVYNESQIDPAQLVSVDAKNESVEEVLKTVLGDVSFKVYENQIIIKKEYNTEALATKTETASTLLVQQNTVKVSGTIVDNSGYGIPGVNVSVKGATTGTITNFDGKYELEVSGDAILVYSFIGFETQEIALAGRTTVDVTMQEEVMSMDEVVVTALGIKREKKALGYSVAEVGDEAFETAKSSNAMSALSGRLSGVQVSSTAQGAGGSTSVIIRGNAIADGSNEPLYVVDGVPISNTQFSNGDSKDHGGIDSGNGMSGIAADDIENISVLKGASATALYGSRAINGVVMITTKSGKGAEGTTIDFASTTTIDQARIYTDWQNVYGQGTYGDMPTNEQESTSNLGMWGARYKDNVTYTDYRGNRRSYKYYDNENSFYDLGVTLSNSVAINHNAENSTLRMSFSNLDNSGMVPNTNYDRNIITLNGTTKAWDGKLEMTGKLSYINEESNNQMIGASPFAVSLVGVPNNVPLSDLKDYKDAETGLPIGFGTRESNLYWNLNEIKHQYNKERVISMGQVKYNFNDNLNAMVRYGNDLTMFKNQSLWPIGTPYYDKGRVMHGNSRDTETNVDGLMSFNKDFQDWGMTINGGAATMIKEYDNVTNFEMDFADPSMQKPSFGSQRTIEAGYYKKKINSVFGTAQFRYGSYLYLDFSARNDWSSTLPSPHSYFYPSVSSSFVFSELFELPSWFTFGKMRASWAEVGSDTDPYMLMLNYKISPDKLPGNGGQATSGQIDGGTIPNKDLKPSMNESIEFGVDLKFFNNRLGIDAAWYRSKANNQIVRVNTSATSGYRNAIINAGAIQNSGVEISLYADPIRTTNFTWTTRLNYAYNKNEVISLTEGVDQLNLFDTKSVTIVARPDEPYGQIMGYKYKRTEDGKIELDANMRPKRSVKTQVLGNAYHKTMLGWINSFTYKNWRATLVLDGKFGGDVYSYTEASAYSNGKHKATLQRDRYTEGELWYPTELEGLGTTSTPDELFGSIASIHEQFIYDASYLAVQEINLAYTFPTNMFENISFMRGASIGVFARNLGYVWKATDNIDPQAVFSISNGGAGVERGSLSLPRNYGVNLNIKF